EPEDMFEALKRMIAAGETFDTIYGLSVFHYFDDARFKELFELMHSCLRPGGYVAFAVKAPGTTFDGVGIPLITREENYESSIGEPGTHRIYEKYVLNLDGQYRNFRDVGALTNLVEGLGFDVIHSSLDGVEQDYEFSNQGSQKFIKFVIQKPQAVVENIDSEKK
ncbi:class I SAM-dependent methyltransferase, partial [Candidatus Gracilibacteria bacterium]|nr:class I SAM-dependent methyltransferase [Candidatus Gracilibacteria bacterium]